MRRADRIEDLTEEQIREIQAGRAVWTPYIPLQISAYILQAPPSAVERLAGLSSREIQDRIDAHDALKALEANL